MEERRSEGKEKRRCVSSRSENLLLIMETGVTTASLQGKNLIHSGAYCAIDINLRMESCQNISLSLFKI